jgi:hypothetical protein
MTCASAYRGVSVGSTLQEPEHEEAQIVDVDRLVEDGHGPGVQSPTV